jgi:hypothetical protein
VYRSPQATAIKSNFDSPFQVPIVPLPEEDQKYVLDLISYEKNEFLKVNPVPIPTPAPKQRIRRNPLKNLSCFALGLNHVTKLVEKKEIELVVLAADVNPILSSFHSRYSYFQSTTFP